MLLDNRNAIAVGKSNCTLYMEHENREAKDKCHAMYLNKILQKNNATN